MKYSTFIKTQDITTAEKLREMGLQEITDASGLYTFLNHKTINFDKSDIDTSKLIYKNTLCI